MSSEFEIQSYHHRIISASGDPAYNDRKATPHPRLYPYIATEMARHVWDIQALVEDTPENLQAKAIDRMWRGQSVCYLVLSPDQCIHYSPSFRRGTLTDPPRGGWIMRLSCEDGVDEQRSTAVEQLSETLVDQLELQEAPHMVLHEPGRGIKISFFTLIVKMESILAARGWSWDAFLEFCWQNNWKPITDGQLVGFSSMNAADLDMIIDALEEHGLQCQEYPVDYYRAHLGDMIFWCFGPEADPKAFEGRALDHKVICSPHDHEIRLSLRGRGGVWATLESAVPR